MAKSDKAEIHELVTKVAKDMIIRYGLRGLNMVELASECGLAKATLYKIIGTKEDLVREIAYEIFNLNIVKMLEPYRSIEDPIEATQKFMDNYFGYAIKGQKVLVQQIYKEYPLIEQDVEKKFKEEMNIVNQRFIEWQQEGYIRKDINVVYCIEALQDLTSVYVTSSFAEEETIDRLRASFKCMVIGMGIELK